MEDFQSLKSNRICSYILSVCFVFQIFVPKEILRQPDLTYHKMKLKDLQDKMGDWVNIVYQVCVCQKSLGAIVVVIVW